MIITDHLRLERYCKLVNIDNVINVCLTLFFDLQIVLPLSCVVSQLSGLRGSRQISKNVKHRASHTSVSVDIVCPDSLAEVGCHSTFFWLPLLGF